MSERYPGPWLGYQATADERPADTPHFLEIAGALANNKIREAAEFYYRLAADDPNEAVVAATADRKHWRMYIVHFRQDLRLVREVDRADRVPAPPW